MKPVPFFLSLTALLAAFPAARAACRIEQVGQLPVEVGRSRIVVTAQLNGQPVRLMVDTGAPSTTLSVEGARRLGLTVHASVSGLRLNGFGGEAQTGVTTIRSLSFGPYSLTNQPVPVAGPTWGPDIIGAVGRDMFQDFDVDVDVPAKMIRLLHPVGCSDADMPYWAKGAYSEAPLEVRNSYLDDYRSEIRLNGRTFPVILDTGTPRTTVTPGAAGLVGVTLASQGSIPARSFGGIGPHRLPSFSGVFQSVSLGEENVKNARIFVADLWKYNVEEETGTRFGAVNGDPNFGVVGLDFFRSHHVLISNSHHKLYLTYEGGPVFLPAPPPAPPGQAPAEP